MPLSRQQLYLLLRGGGLPKNIGSVAAQTAATAPQIGQQAKQITQQNQQRGQLLAGAINAGTLQPNQLSPQDLDLVRSKLNKGASEFGGGFLSDVGDLLGNLGSDIGNAAKGIPEGLLHMGMAAEHDVVNLAGRATGNQNWGASPAGNGPSGLYGKTPPSQIKSQVIDPVIDSYKYTYGGVGAPEGSTLKGRLAAHPLQPILDTLTIASLGSDAAIGGASALTRAGGRLGELGQTAPIQALARAGSTEGRAPVVLNPGQQDRAGVAFPEIPRRYSSRPVMKAGQIGWDKLADNIGGLRDFETNRTVKRLQRHTYANGLAAEAAAVRAAITPLVGSRRGLTTDEATALDYALRGWNTPDKIALSKQMFQDAYDGNLPEGWNMQDFQGMFKTPDDARSFLLYKANLPHSVEQLILHPTDNMINAAQATHEAAAKGFDDLGLTDEEIQAHIGASQKVLDDYANGRLGQDPGNDPGMPGDPPVEPDPQGPGPDNGPQGPYIEELDQIAREEFDAQDFQSLSDSEKQTIWDYLDQQGQVAATGPAGIEGKPIGEATGQDLRNMVLGDGPGLEGSGFPSTADMDFEMVRQEQAKGRIDQGTPGLTAYPDGDGTGNWRFWTFVWRDEHGDPVAISRASEAPRDEGFDNPDHIADYEEFALSPDADLDHLANEAVQWFKNQRPISEVDPAAGDAMNAERDAWEGDNLPPLNSREPELPSTMEELQSMDDVELASLMDQVHEARRTEANDSIWDEENGQGPEVAEQASIDATRRTKAENHPTVESFIQSWMQHFEERAGTGSSLPEQMDEMMRQLQDQIDVPDIPNTPDELLNQAKEGDFQNFMDAVSPNNEIDQKVIYTGDEIQQALRPPDLQTPGEPHPMGPLGHINTWTTEELNKALEIAMRAFNVPAEELPDIYKRLEEHPGIDGEGIDDVESFVEAVAGPERLQGLEDVNPDFKSQWIEGHTAPNVPQIPDTPEGLLSQIGDRYADDQPPEWYDQRARESAAMEEFGKSWDELTPEQQSQAESNIVGLSDSRGFSPGFQDQLNEIAGDEPAAWENDPPNVPPPTDFEFNSPGDGEYPIEPTYVPNLPAAGFQAQQPGRLARMFGADEQTFGRGKRQRNVSAMGATAQNLFADTPGAVMRERPEVLASGAARIDPAHFVESVARREKDLIKQGFNQELLDRLAAKDEAGDPLKFQNQEDVYKRLGDKWVLVNEQFPINWFAAETNFAQDTVEALAKLREQGLSEHDPQVEAIISQLADSHAQDFVRNAFSAQKLDGVAIPREFFNYQKRLVTSQDPFDNKVGRVYARYMHRWRAFTLAYMPRWAVNTAVGSFFMNMVKGVTPRDYALAAKMKSQGVFGEPRLGGIELGGLTGMEYLEPAAMGHLERTTGVRMTPMGEHIVEKVQQIEDHFRRASFVHSLDKVAQRRMSDMGQVISNLERRRTTFYDTRRPWSARTDDETLQRLLGDPDAVQEAIDDLNTFAYNFAALGPYERRYVRMAVPFWGWYKFISKVAYRLPVEYPGRANVLANLGMLGAGYEDQELGRRPDWLHGIIPLGLEKGRLSYLSTMGQNPFSSFFNPLGPQGGVEGAITLGQASPPIQALLSAFGLDSLRGGEVPISPQQGVAPDYFGSLIDLKNGRETNPAQQAGVRRLVMGLLRSAPQFRMGEQWLAGGRSVYPESIPFFDQRPMPTDPKDTSLLANLGQIFGVAPKSYDLGGYQKGIKKRVKYAKARNKTSLKRLRKSNRDVNKKK